MRVEVTVRIHPRPRCRVAKMCAGELVYCIAGSEPHDMHGGLRWGEPLFAGAGPDHSHAPIWYDWPDDSLGLWLEDGTMIRAPRAGRG